MHVYVHFQNDQIFENPERKKVEISIETNEKKFEFSIEKFVFFKFSMEKNRIFDRKNFDQKTADFRKSEKYLSS